MVAVSAEGSMLHLGTSGFEYYTSLLVPVLELELELELVANYKLWLFVGNNLGEIGLKILLLVVVSSWLHPGTDLLATVTLVEQILVCQEEIRRHCSSLGVVDEELPMEAETQTIHNGWTS